MRVLALAAVCGALFVGGVASAETWRDPQGRVTFDAPRGWSTAPSRRINQATSTYAVSGTANNECQVAAVPNATTAHNTPNGMRASSADATRFTNEVWTQSLNRFSEVFPDNSAQVQSTSVDTSGFWPIQRAEVRAGDQVVHAAMTFRPGFEIITMCLTYGGADPTTVYDAFIRSVGHPNDAAWQAAPDAAGQ